MNEVLSVLNSYPLDCQPSRADRLGSAGGMSGAQFWRITAPRGTLCLRRWPAEHPTPERLQLIHAVLEHAARNGIQFIPVLLHTRAGESFVLYAGHLWELAPWMPGDADYERSPSTEKLKAAMRALAQFHLAASNFTPPSAPGYAGGHNAITRRLTRLRQLMCGGTAQLSIAITDSTWPELAPLARQFIATLPHVIPGATLQLEALASTPLPLQVCLRDIWHDHVLFTGNEVTGIIDFGAVDIDTPATDVARLLGSLILPPPCGEGASSVPIWREGIAAYSAVRPLSDDETRAIRALDTSSTILAGCNWIRWIYIERRQFEDQRQVINRYRRLVARTQQMFL